MRRLLYLFALMLPVLCSAQSAPASGPIDPSLFLEGRCVAAGDTLPYRIYASNAARQLSAPAGRQSAQHAASNHQLPSEPIPLVIFLHGAGERGNDNLAQLNLCVPFFLNDTVSSRYPFLLLCPQCPAEKRWVDTDWRLVSHKMPAKPTPQMTGVFYLIDSLVASGTVDPSRIYISGISMGGFGVWDALQRKPRTFAAAIAVCGGGDPAYVGNLVNVPLRVFHGERDKLVKPSRSRMMYDAIRRAGGKYISFTLYPDLGHLCWDRAFSTSGLFDWLFQQHLSTNER